GDPARRRTHPDRVAGSGTRPAAGTAHGPAARARGRRAGAAEAHVVGAAAAPLGLASDPGQGVTLALDAAAPIGTVAVLRDGELVARRTIVMRSADEERYLPAALDALEECGASATALDHVVCGAGPGSFTSLRVAGAIAKGLALGTGCPLWEVPSLALIV